MQVWKWRNEINEARKRNGREDGEDSLRYNCGCPDNLMVHRATNHCTEKKEAVFGMIQHVRAFFAWFITKPMVPANQ